MIDRCSSLPASLRHLVAAIEAEERLSPSAMKRIVEESDVTAADLKAWADFDHPAADSYGRKMVHDGGYFEIMAMSWVDGDMAAIHDHGYTQWGAVKVFGSIEHAIFRHDEGVLTTAERRRFAPGSVVAVGHDLIHQMGNVGQEPYLTLHLYGCYERQGDVTADARLYELDEQVVQVTSGGVFYALPEAAVSRRLEASPADFATTLRFKVELLRRLLRANGTWTAGSLQSEREVRIAGELFARETWQQARQELEAKLDGSPLQLERYFEVLQQELRAVGRLQLELLDAGLAGSVLEARRGRLAEILRRDDLAEAAEEYLDLLGSVLAIEFPAVMAVA